MSQISWEDSSWRQLSLVHDDEDISLSHAKVYVFSNSVLCLGKVNQNPTSNAVWEDQLGWFKDSTQYRTLDTVDGEPMEFEWNISQDLPHCSSATKSKSSWTKWATQHNPKDDLSSCRCSMTSYGELKTMNGNVLQTPHLCLYLQKDFQQDVGHSSDLDQKRSGFSTKNERPRGEWDRVADLMMIQFRESGHPVFWTTSPVSRGTLKRKGGDILSIHFCADGDTIETVFRTNIFGHSAQYLRSSLRCVWGIR